MEEYLKQSLPLSLAFNLGRLSGSLFRVLGLRGVDCHCLCDALGRAVRGEVACDAQNIICVLPFPPLQPLLWVRGLEDIPAVSVPGDCVGRGSAVLRPTWSGLVDSVALLPPRWVLGDLLSANPVYNCMSAWLV